ncbi:hypothetical protein SO802_016946 [Lithocarpus litseifolius]|uniref:RNase H type-1 domain-containing protein n=1 Tax=Lithocarpus litseifolius TaxID=425828 RepID=A0AAW2CXZ6_9ROSI
MHQHHLQTKNEYQVELVPKLFSNFNNAIGEKIIYVAVVGRDDSGKLLLAWTEQLDPGNSLLGEAKAAWWAIKCAAMEGYRNIILEGDALNVIDPLKNANYVPRTNLTLQRAMNSDLNARGRGAIEIKENLEYSWSSNEVDQYFQSGGGIDAMATYDMTQQVARNEDRVACTIRMFCWAGLLPTMLGPKYSGSGSWDQSNCNHLGPAYAQATPRFTAI